MTARRGVGENLTIVSRRARRPLSVRSDKAAEATTPEIATEDPPVDADTLAVAVAGTRPWVYAVSDGGVLAVILYPMMFKPF